MGTGVCRMKLVAAAVLVSLLLLCVPPFVQGLSTGAPSIACATFTPGHNIAAQTTDPPYLLYSSGFSLEGGGCYVPDQVYTIELASILNGTAFDGFLIMAESENTSTGVGRFLNVDGIAVQYGPCGPYEASVTHTVNTTGTVYESFSWQAPSVATGSIRFRWTVVQSYSVFWANMYTASICEGNAVCEEGAITLYGNYTTTYGNGSAIGGTPLGCISDQYAAFCNDNTSDPASADVLCTELGYYGGGMYVNTYSDPPSGTVIYTNFSCPSGISSISECDADPVSSCDKGPLGLICYLSVTEIPPSTCYDGEIRLVPQFTDVQGAFMITYGIPQICYNGTSLPICNTTTDYNAYWPEAVCMQLGYADVGYIDSVENPFFFLGDIIGSIDCFENSSLSSCTIGTISSDNCPGTIFLLCSSGNAVCEEGAFTLYENYTTTYGNGSAIGGTPLGCIAGQYATVCNDNTSDPASADVLCTQLGYHGGGMYVNTYSDPPNGTVIYTNFSCPSGISSISECDAEPVSSCDKGPLGLICYLSAPPQFPCSDGEIRLSPRFPSNGSGYELNAGFELLAGLLEICYSGSFLSVCNTTDYDPLLPQAACAQLGYPDYAIDRSSENMFSEHTEVINSVECSNSSLSSCTLGTTSSDECFGVVSLVCINSTYPPCSNGEFRLVRQFSVSDNESGYEFLAGRLQICYNGAFLPVCNTSDYEPFLPQAVCTSLGYPDDASVEDSFFAFTIQDEIVDSITCTDSSLSSCTVDTTISPESCSNFIRLNCLRSNAVCEEGAFTLYENYTTTYGSESAIGGTPLGCVSGRYATLCNDNTSDPASADVFCTHLGYYGGGMYINSYSGLPNGTLFYSNFSCSSGASSVEECDAAPVSSCDKGPLGLICYIPARNDCLIDVNDATNTPCVNGYCVDGNNTFFCRCFTGWTGTLCNVRVSTPAAPVIVTPPMEQNVPYEGQATFECLATGIPDPTYTWFKNGEVISDQDLPTLYFAVVQVSDRGLYSCTVTNSEGRDESQPVYLRITDIVQYASRVEVASDEQKREALQELLEMVITELTGQYITGPNGTAASIVEVYVADPNLIITVQDTTGFVRAENVDNVLATFSTGTFTFLPAQRYDGCVATTTVLSEGTIMWMESSIGDTVVVSCPCGSVNPATVAEKATRTCAGDFTTAGIWEEANVVDCSFSMTTSLLCSLSDNSNLTEVTEFIAELTASSGNLDANEINLIAGFMEEIAVEATQNEEARADYLDILNNLLDIDQDILAESEEETGAVKLVLESIQSFGASVVMTTNVSTFIRPNFAIEVEDVGDNFVGVAFVVALDDNGKLGEDSLESGSSNRPTSSVDLPPTLLEGQNMATSDIRVVFGTYVDDTFFVQGDEDRVIVTSIIISADVYDALGSVRVQELNTPVRLHFVPNNLATASRCVFYNEEQLSWDSEGCSTIRGDGNEIECQCYHLSSFTIIEDAEVIVSTDSSTEPTSSSTDELESLYEVEIILFVGPIVAVFFIILALVSYAISNVLHGEVLGKVIIMSYIVLIAFYIVFVVAAGASLTDSDGFCVTMAAFVHYLMITYLFWMFAEALLYFWKLSRDLEGNVYTRNYFLITSMVCFAAPLLVVIITLASTVSRSINDYIAENSFCRPQHTPFLGALLAPIVLVYVLTLVVNFATVIYSTVIVIESQAQRALVMPNLFSNIVLNLVFAVVILFFIASTDVSMVGSTSTILQYLFGMASVVHAVLTFVFVFIRAKGAQGVQKNLLNRITGRSARYTFNPTYKTSAVDETVCEENEYTVMTDLESVKKTSSEGAREVKPPTKDSPEPDTEQAKLDLSKHVDEGEELETAMVDGEAVEVNDKETEKTEAKNDETEAKDDEAKEVSSN